MTTVDDEVVATAAPVTPSNETVLSMITPNDASSSVPQLLSHPSTSLGTTAEHTPEKPPYWLWFAAMLSVAGVAMLMLNLSRSRSS